MENLTLDNLSLTSDELKDIVKYIALKRSTTVKNVIKTINKNKKHKINKKKTKINKNTTKINKITTKTN